VRFRNADNPDAEFERLVRYVGLSQKLRKSFESVPSYSYPEQESSIEDLVTVKMTYLLDGRVIDFYEHNRATAKSLRDIIRSKQRFPKEEFSKLKKAFPCILAGIRDYAEYIPLEPEVFDLLIIDEASQVSIAQAFPALLRAKKILILGDKKQFSNIKAAQARSDTNREYQNNLRTVFTTSVAHDSSKLIRFEKFNIKTSILEFFEYISNYHTQLVKHFRGYKELISYSNKYFYQDSLQVMKVRGKGINEVLQFSPLTPSGMRGSGLNTNPGEVDYIIQELKKLRDAKATLSVGIITPHTNQQKLLIESISRLPERDYFFNDLKLKIMTFDTCQGEERDLVFYSMVATPLEDHLWGVFIKDLGSVDVEEEGKIKAQRLNVGFSRARECMHFVLSKPLDQYQGSVGEALRHYRFVLDEGKKEKSTSDVDPKSEMEPVVLTWFYQTSFWRDEKDHITLIPQFEIGKYLKQLDKTYSHPLYKVDFLLVYRNTAKADRKIIIEYDGFREHFKDLAAVTRGNYQEYYSEDDVYRQKVLESYGYKFLRINKFNVGKNPIATLDERLRALIDDSTSVTPALASIHSAIEGLQNGQVKECPKCKNVRDINEFRDQSLTSGYGRFCIHCKKTPAPRHRAKSVTKEAASVQFGPAPCPRCGSKMILRKGRYGKFYGCSRFPYCRATRQVTS
jgi:very-short-patch-repair endonuclease